MPSITPTTTEGYKVSRILLVREETEGVIPTNPKCIAIKAEDAKFNESQANEVISLLGSFDADAQAFGTKTIDGTLDMILSVENTPILIQGGVGKRLTTADATADAWTALQVQAVGDMVNSVDAKHTLVCTVAGTTGANETSFVPNLAVNPKDDQNKKIVDGTVTWVAQPKLKADAFQVSEFLDTYTVEITYKTPTGELYYRRMSNCYFGGFPMSMSGGTISVKASLSLQGVSYMESIDDDWDEDLLSKAGAVLLIQSQDSYDYESFKNYVDGVAECVETIELSIARDATVTDLIMECKDVNIGKPTISGNINRIFSTVRKAEVAAHTAFEAKFEFKKANGCELILTYSHVVPSNSNIDVAVDKKAYLTNDINADGEGGTISVSATVIYPSFVDDAAGTLVDALG